MDILPRELDLFDVDVFDDQSTPPTDDWLTSSTEPIESLLAQSTAPTDDWTAQSFAPTDDWLLPPAEPFENFDPDQDTISTHLFDLPPSSTSPLTELDLSAPFAFEPPVDAEYSTIPTDQTAEEIAARKCAERDRNRYFDVPTRRCDPGTYPFCAIGDSVTPDPLGVTLDIAADRMYFSLLLVKIRRNDVYGLSSIFINMFFTHMLT